MNQIDDHSRTASECVCCGSQSLERSPAILMPFVAHRVYQWTPVVIDESWGLHTVPNGLAYPLCNSLLCNQCSLLFLDIRFSDKELSRLYRDYRDESYTALREHYEPGYRARNQDLKQGISYLNKVEDFLRPHLPENIRILDWGGDTGVNTPFKSNSSNSVHLYDISGQETVGRVRKVSLQTAKNNTYDLVICSNVLEHVSYPKRLMGDILQHMTSSTILYLEIPHEQLVKRHQDKKQMLSEKKHWHEHINFFCKESIRALVDAMGLNIFQFQELDIENESQPRTVFQAALVRL
jgi:hypothetical protein